MLPYTQHISKTKSPSLLNSIFSKSIIQTIWEKKFLLIKLFKCACAMLGTVFLLIVFICVMYNLLHIYTLPKLFTKWFFFKHFPFFSFHSSFKRQDSTKSIYFLKCAIFFFFIKISSFFFSVKCLSMEWATHVLKLLEFVCQTLKQRTLTTKSTKKNKEKFLNIIIFTLGVIYFVLVYIGMYMCVAHQPQVDMFVCILIYGT